MARVIIVKEFTEEVNVKLLTEVERLGEPLLYATDNATHCVVLGKGKRMPSMIKVITPDIWHKGVYAHQLESAEVWQ